jgi:hypothetical protein
VACASAVRGGANVSAVLTQPPRPPFPAPEEKNRLIVVVANTVYAHNLSQTSLAQVVNNTGKRNENASHRKNKQVGAQMHATTKQTEHTHTHCM